MALFAPAWGVNDIMDWGHSRQTKQSHGESTELLVQFHQFWPSTDSLYGMWAWTLWIFEFVPSNLWWRDTKFAVDVGYPADIAVWRLGRLFIYRKDESNPERKDDIIGSLLDGQMDCSVFVIFSTFLAFFESRCGVGEEAYWYSSGST